jgi:hypothetical protein
MHSLCGLHTVGKAIRRCCTMHAVASGCFTLLESASKLTTNLSCCLRLHLQGHIHSRRVSRVTRLLSAASTLLPLRMMSAHVENAPTSPPHTRQAPTARLPQLPTTPLLILLALLPLLCCCRVPPAPPSAQLPSQSNMNAVGRQSWQCPSCIGAPWRRQCRTMCMEASVIMRGMLEDCLAWS